MGSILVVAASGESDNSTLAQPVFVYPEGDLMNFRFLSLLLLKANNNSERNIP